MRHLNVESPCVNICSVDPNTNLCVGCFRTLSEIAKWTTMSDDHRMKINEKCENRKDTMFE